uniref:Replisome organizer protein n=1 Tax=Siphoviridae sp. ct0106 TaxID=2825290 RepID=A0A8S5P518_9CAUD|nr:MAG TPA: replisome organizer protein [Siphoviridae sp. ct0106]
MSFTAIMQALNLPEKVKGNGRLTAIAIANRVNMHPEHDNQLCAWPSIKGLARDIGASKTAVKSSLNILEELGVITRVPRFINNEKIATLYIWHPWRIDGWDDSAMRRREDAERGYVREETPEVPASAPAPAPATPAPEAPAKPTEKPADGFTEWWPHYPKKVKKLDAEKAYRAALKRGVTPKELLDGLQRQKAAWKAKGTEPQYIPYPATWLRAGSWEDELETPTHDTSSPTPAINPATGKPVTRDDFGYACIAAGIDPNLYINYWKPYMGLPSDPGWPEWAAKIDRFCGRA